MIEPAVVSAAGNLFQAHFTGRRAQRELGRRRRGSTFPLAKAYRAQPVPKQVLPTSSLPSYVLFPRNFLQREKLTWEPVPSKPEIVELSLVHVDHVQGIIRSDIDLLTLNMLSLARTSRRHRQV